MININELQNWEAQLYHLPKHPKLPISSHIELYENMTTQKVLEYQQHGLSREEAFILLLFIGFSSKWINQELSNKKPTLDKLQSMVVTFFDDILLKIEKSDDGFVYRMDNFCLGLRS